MSYTLADVFNQQLLDKCTTLADIEALVGQMSGQVLDVSGNISAAQRLLYSGSIDGTPVWQSVENLIAGAPNKYASITESQVGELLNAPAFKAKLSEITNLDPLSTEFKNLLNGSTDSPTGKYGLWGNASETFVLEPTNSNFRSIAPFAVDDSVYAAKELPALLQRAANGVPTVIEGIDSQNLLKAFGEASALDNGASAVANLNKVIQASGALNSDIIMPAMSVVESTSLVEGISNVLSKGGPYLVGLSALLIAGQASAAAMDGNTAKAGEIVGVGLAEMGAGIAGGTIASAAAIAAVDAFVIALGATAGLDTLGPVGAAASFLIAVGAGLYGGYQASEAVKAVADHLLAPPTTTTNQDGSITVRYTDGTVSTLVTNPDNTSTVSTANPNGNTSVTNYDADHIVTDVTTRTYNPADGSFNITNNNAVTGINTSENYNANNQIVSSSTIDTTTNTGTLKSYTNGVETSLIDFSPTRSTTTNFDPTTHQTTDITTVNADNSGSTEKFNPATGQLVSSSLTDTTGATTTATTNADGSVTTQYPNGDISVTVTDTAGLPTVYTRSPDGATTIISYATPGEPIVMPDGHFSNMTEQTGNITYNKITNPDGSGSEVKYNPDHSGAMSHYGADGSSSTTGYNADGTSYATVKQMAANESDWQMAA